MNEDTTVKLTNQGTNCMECKFTHESMNFETLTSAYA